MYLNDTSKKVHGEYLAGPWAEVKRALMQRRPSYSEANDAAETAAHRSFERKGYEKCLADIEALATETSPEDEPLIPVTLTDPRD